MSNDEYDIEKVDKTPWTIHEQWYSHPRQNDQLLFNIKDADGYFIASHSSKDTAQHIVHCVNEHEALEADRKRLDWLYENEKIFRNVSADRDFRKEIDDAIDAAMKESP